MNLGEKDIKRIFALFVVLLLFVLSYLVVKTLFVAVISGLILSYIFHPVYVWANKFLKYPTLSAWTISIIIIVIIFVPLWFVFPLIAQQAYTMFSDYQMLDVRAVVVSFFPSASDRFISQMTLTLSNAASSLTLAVSQTFVDFLLNLPTLLIDLFILAFVFFYGLRDGEKLKEFLKSIAQLSKENEDIVIKHFKDMTDSVIYGQIIIGIVQGILAGIGFAIFGINNALILTLLAVLFSIIPFVGAWAVWVPVNLYLFASGDINVAIAYLLYNVLIVSVADNILRSYFISKRTNVSPAIVIVGMIGGVYVFNFIGLIIGPLILAYLIAVLESFKDRSFYNLFSNDSSK